MGQERRFGDVGAMSIVPLKADIKADIADVG
jgi:hypothetical protein